MNIRPIVIISFLALLAVPVHGLAQTDLETQFKAGTAAVDKGDFSTGIRIFTGIIDGRKDIPGAYHVRGVAYYQAGDYDRAISDLSEALRMYADDADFKTQKLAALRSLGLSYFEADQPGKAYSQFDAALKLDPKEAAYLHLRAQAAYAMGEYEKAVADQDQAIAMDGLLKRLPFEREMAKLNGEIYRHPEDAKARYQRAMASFAKFRSLNGTKQLFRASPELTAAIADLDRATSLDAKYAEAWVQRGMAEEIDTTGMHVGPVDEAMPFYDKAIAANPNLGEAYLRRGLLLSKKMFAKGDEKARAAADLTKAVALGVKNAEGYMALGDLSESRGDHAQALSNYSAAIAIDPKDAKPLEHRAEAYEDNKDWVHATEDRTRIVALKPDDTEALAHRAKTYESAGRFAEAAQDWTMVIAKDPSGMNYSRRADGYVAGKDYARAFADYSKAIELEPDDADYYLGRARAYRLSNDSAKALADYRKAHEVDATVPQISPDLSNAAAVDANRGNIGRIAGRYTKAIGKLSEASAAVEKDKKEISDMAAAFLRNANETEDEKLARLTKAVDDGSAKAADYTTRGTLNLKKRNTAAAMGDYNKALELDGKQTEALFYRGFIRGANGEFDAAIADLDRFIALQPDVANGFFYRGNAYFGKKDTERALAD